MRSPSRRPFRTALIGALLTGSLVATSAALVPTAAADGFDRSVHAKKGDRTPFAFRAVTYGSRVRGGDLPVSSGTTSYQGIGCTNVAGVDKHNSIGTAELPSLGQVSGVKTRAWTERANGVHSSYSTHEIDRIVLHEDSFGQLAIKGLSSLARAYHDAQGFHAVTETAVQSLVYTPTNGAPQVLSVPKPGQPVIIPGVLEIHVGVEKTRASSNHAKAIADVLDVKLLPTNTRVKIAHTAAQIARGVKRGLFAGLSAATEVRALNNLVHSGPQPLTRMPCQGTQGKVKGKDVAAVDLLPVIEVGAASTRQMGQQRPKRAFGYEEARIAQVDLGGGQLVITGIRGRANVERTREGVTFDSKGTTIGSATVDGTEYSFPELDGLSIPGLVQIDTNVVTEMKSGLDVVAVRLTLLDGSGAVIDLGHAQLLIAGSGLK
ncbi:choice-of-anchor P family protein [Nocardioides sp.]|uniref:choice-of-anchor P family protein n=1 Tax=Nocardioides sp. TaxID=35761 RepID=UPI001A294B77|nr:choice-of-anchor P family protein [Nocardioides sp.]MBJ7359179.1 hypothetical protein [Nocardioides sp.]